MFKWACLSVATVALAVFLWMLNDLRLRVTELAANADRQLAEVKGLTDRANNVLSQADRVTSQLDVQVPKLLQQADKTVMQLDSHLPQILMATEKTTENINKQLPTLIEHTQIAVDGIAEMTGALKEYKGLFGVVHAAHEDKGLFTYGASILDLVEGQDATLEKKKPDGTKHMVPAREWAKSTRKEVQFLSVSASSEKEVLHGLAATHTKSPWYIHMADQAPRLLTDWLRESHPETRKLIK
jgi:hypothetical protein